MTSINLVSKAEEKPSSSLAKEWTACAVAIVLLFLIYFGLIAYNRFLVKNEDNLTSDYNSQYNYLMENGKNVFDFQNRLKVASPLVLEKNYAIESLDQIEKMIIPGVYAESFEWDAEKANVNLECVTNEYRWVANQVASFKKSDYFSKVTINETKSREDGKISFLLELGIKNKK